MRYLKKTTHKEIENLWGFSFVLPRSHREQHLYLVVKRNGTPHTRGGGKYITQSEVLENDVIL